MDFVIFDIEDVQVAPITKTEDEERTKIAIFQALQLIKSKNVPVAVIKPVPKPGKKPSNSIAIYTPDLMPQELRASMQMIYVSMASEPFLQATASANVSPPHNKDAVVPNNTISTTSGSRSRIAKSILGVANDILANFLSSLVSRFAVTGNAPNNNDHDEGDGSANVETHDYILNQGRSLMALQTGDEFLLRTSPSNFNIHPSGLLKRCVERNNLIAKMFVKDGTERDSSLLLINFLVPSHIFSVRALLTQVGIDMRENAPLKCEELFHVDEGDILVTLLPSVG